ncbi:MAG TPA: hypothetical protein VHY91_16670 [Pirellulales bacterium]|jgi:hypothetical protein|nr:hypothetical protein [Pirellulales bacterium]
MIDMELRRRLEAVKDGEITAGHLVRPIILDATRQIDAWFEEAWEARRLLHAAKENFAMGWEPEYLETGEED